MLALTFIAMTGALLTTPPVITMPSSMIYLPNPSVIHLPSGATPTRHVGGIRGLPAPHSASRLQLPMGPQPALLSWSGASTFRALVKRNTVLAVERIGRTRRTCKNAGVKCLGWEPRAGLLSWRGASTFRALVKRNTVLAVQSYGYGRDVPVAC